MTKIENNSVDRAAFYLAERVRQLPAEVETCRAAMQQGRGAEMPGVFRRTVAKWLKRLETDFPERR
jgi:CRP-like cAMP-binding protein